MSDEIPYSTNHSFQCALDLFLRFTECKANSINHMDEQRCNGSYMQSFNSCKRSFTSPAIPINKDDELNKCIVKATDNHEQSCQNQGVSIPGSHERAQINRNYYNALVECSRTTNWTKPETKLFNK